MLYTSKVRQTFRGVYFYEKTRTKTTRQNSKRLLFGMLVIPSVGVSRSRVYLFINFYRAYSLSTPAYYFLRYAPCGRLAPLVGMTFLAHRLPHYAPCGRFAPLVGMTRWGFARDARRLAIPSRYALLTVWQGALGVGGLYAPRERAFFLFFRAYVPFLFF